MNKAEVDIFIKDSVKNSRHYQGDVRVMTEKSVNTLMEMVYAENRTCFNCKDWHTRGEVVHPNYRECNNKDTYNLLCMDTEHH